MNVFQRASQIADEGQELQGGDLAEFLSRDAGEPVSGEDFCRWIATGLANMKAPKHRTEQQEGGGRVHNVNLVDGIEVVGVTS